MLSSVRLLPDLPSAEPATVSPGSRRSFLNWSCKRRLSSMSTPVRPIPSLGAGEHGLDALQAESAVLDGCWCLIPSHTFTFQNSLRAEISCAELLTTIRLRRRQRSLESSASRVRFHLAEPALSSETFASAGSAGQAPMLWDRPSRRSWAFPRAPRARKPKSGIAARGGLAKSETRSQGRRQVRQLRLAMSHPSGSRCHTPQCRRLRGK